MTGYTGSQLNKKLSDLVDSFVMDNNPSALDDMLPDLLSDPDQRNEAIDDLINYIENNKEEIWTFTKNYKNWELIYKI